jgi:lysine 6-dehydrogenase
MNIIVLGSGMMGQAIAYDLSKFSNFDNITIADNNKETLEYTKKIFKNKKFIFQTLDLDKPKDVNQCLQGYDIAISAVPYKYNYFLAKTVIETKTHFLDLGGNNTIVEKERSLSDKAKKNDVTIIPDCGLAPGLTSVITKDIVDQMSSIDFVKIRVGGLPMYPQPPLNYQIVFSPYGLINEYVEDAIILKNGNIIKKKSMTDLEKIIFPEPFGQLEAFLTSGGCSTLPYTYNNKIKYLDYKTIRYPGHCEQFKTLLNLGLAEEKPINVKGKTVILRDLFADVLLKNLPKNKEDVVLIKVFCKGENKNKEDINLEYTCVDYYDSENKITAMMRTTGYPVSIIAQMIEQDTIKKRGVYCSEEIVPCKPFFRELDKRKIQIKKNIRKDN